MAVNKQARENTFADRIIAFNKQLSFKGSLPNGIQLMNPYKESALALTSSSAFYQKFYNDNDPRHLILGINPGRFGSAMTGVSFTDPKRLIAKCGIPFTGQITHEPSSDYIYEMIDAYGGVQKFYHQFYIHSVCPLGFTTIGSKGKVVNYNYYDDPDLLKAAYPFILENIDKQIGIGFETDLCYCFGTGKNEAFFRKLNQQMGYFKKIIALEHPRFIMQYKSKTKQHYIEKYLKAFGQATI